MTNTKALSQENPTVIRNLLLTAFLAVAVALSPKQAHADNAGTAAAVLIGAAVLYAAHDSHKSDRHYAKHHVHDRHCGHRVEYRGSGHHDRYGNAHGYYQNHYTRDRYTAYQGKHHKYVEQKHGKQYGNQYSGKHYKQDRYVRDDHKSGKYRKDDRHREQSWNTRVRVSQGH